MSGITGEELTKLLTRRLRRQHASHPIVYKDIEEFCGISQVTSRRWLRGQKIMGGSTTIKVWHFLSVLGVKSQELKNVQEFHPYGAFLNELLGFSVITTNDVLDAFGFAAKGYQTNLIFRHMRGETKRFDKKPAFSLEQLHEMYDAELKEKKDYWQNRLGRSTTVVAKMGKPTAEADETKETSIELTPDDISSLEVVAKPETAEAVTAIEPEDIEQLSVEPALPTEAEQAAEELPTEAGDEGEDPSQTAMIFTSSSKPKAEPEAITSLPVQQPASAAEVPVRHELVLSTAEKLMAGTATAVFADLNFTDEEKGLLRVLMGGSLLVLSNVVDRLTSARASRQTEGK